MPSILPLLLGPAKTVNIEVLSGLFDPYVFLLQGTGKTGSVLYFNDDDTEKTVASRLRNLSLPAGSYTIEVTSYEDAGTGDFRITLTTE